MVFKVSGLFNQLKNKLGLGPTEPSGPIMAHADCSITKSTPEQRPQLQQPSLQGLGEPNELQFEHADKINAEVHPIRSQAKRSSRGSKPETPMRQRWRRSAVRAAKKAQGLERR